MAARLVVSSLDATRGINVPFIDTLGQFGPVGGVAITVADLNSGATRTIPLSRENDGLLFIDANGTVRVVVPRFNNGVNGRLMTIPEFRAFVAENRGRIFPANVTAEQLFKESLVGATPSLVSGGPAFLNSPQFANLGPTGAISTDPPNNTSATGAPGKINNFPAATGPSGTINSTLINTAAGPLTPVRFAQLQALANDVRLQQAAQQRVASIAPQIALFQQQAALLGRQASPALRAGANSFTASARQLTASIANEQALLSRLQAASPVDIQLARRLLA